VKRYIVNEVFLTIQGEGAHTGRTAVFCRFSRCNLWTGREQDRHKAICKFCDTDFASYTGMSLEALVAAIEACWPGADAPMVVFTGGEPAIQLDEQLLDALHEVGYYIAIETNGTITLPRGIDWICVSPKADTKLRVYSGDELKLVYPQPEAPPERFADMLFGRFWLSPMDGPNLAQNTAAALDYVLAHPQWRLNIQTHKVIGAR
jgi:7-carboxy-7-deazaguanine synthase (Cx14CxxC type)